MSNIPFKPDPEDVAKKQVKIAKLMQIAKITYEGYAGILPNGNIVDRREFPHARPIPANKLLNIGKPKKL